MRKYGHTYYVHQSHYTKFALTKYEYLQELTVQIIQLHTMQFLSSLSLTSSLSSALLIFLSSPFPSSHNLHQFLNTRDQSSLQCKLRGTIIILRILRCLFFSRKGKIYSERNDINYSLNLSALNFRRHAILIKLITSREQPTRCGPLT